ncbi:Protein of unknown function DUF2921 [Cinnamomum micranthum f. kanehirae]|uniref:DUF2921 domain-containing protein n=1 Tax=Cinnamomum micranthum f. kanehirae TaxID=337451 RepID=A0A443PZP0_9MAGN|nr:Protein of unknown function DUF2921 [Cinnamomum micranthum f. kanehirae]
MNSNPLELLGTQTPDFMRSVLFHTENLIKTNTEGVLKVPATLTFDEGQIYLNSHPSSTVKLRNHRQGGFHYGRAGSVSFELQGFWSESTGKLCMVGTGHGVSEEGDYIQLSAITKINYPKRSDINTSIVTGMVESIDLEDSSNYFNPISVLGFSQKMYSYSMVTEIQGTCGEGDYNGKKSLGLEPGTSICSMFKPFKTSMFQLNYRGHCSAGKCSLFNGFFPELMSVGGIQCSSEGKVHLYLRFSNLSSAWRSVPLIPETALVAEGVWDEEKNQLCMVGCPLKNFEGSLAETHVRDCSVGLSLTFPKVWSLKMRSPTVGSIWSLKKSNESMYFDRIEFRSFSDRALISDLTYNYTALGQVKNSCAKKYMKKKSGKKFPDGFSFTNMKFNMYLKTKSRSAWGSATPLSLGEVFYDRYSSEVFSSSSIRASNITAQVSNSNHDLLNVSYSIHISF